MDISPFMLKVLTKKAKIKNIKNLIKLILLVFNLPDHSVKMDKVISKFALNHLPSLPKSLVLLNLYRILKRDGKLYLSDLIYNIHSRNIKYP